jgi:hypothetical protein
VEVDSRRLLARDDRHSWSTRLPIPVILVILRPKHLHCAVKSLSSPLDPHHFASTSTTHHDFVDRFVSRSSLSQCPTHHGPTPKSLLYPLLPLCIPPYPLERHPPSTCECSLDLHLPQLGLRRRCDVRSWTRWSWYCCFELGRDRDTLRLSIGESYARDVVDEMLIRRTQDTLPSFKPCPTSYRGESVCKSILNLDTGSFAASCGIVECEGS